MLTIEWRLLMTEGSCSHFKTLDKLEIPGVNDSCVLASKDLNLLSGNMCNNKQEMQVKHFQCGPYFELTS